MVATENERVRTPVYALAFETRHDCIVGRLSRSLPDLNILHWCVPERAVFQVSGPGEDIRSFEDWADQNCQVQHRSILPEGILLVTKYCCKVLSGRSIFDIIEEVGAWDIPPIVYREGWESWRIIVWGEESVQNLSRAVRSQGQMRLRSLRPVENVQLEKMMLLPAPDIFSGLTDRQMSALMLGLDHGYYSLPSQTKIALLARGAGLAPSTFSEHLRKAESRVLRNLQPYLQAYSARAPGEPAVEAVAPGRSM